VDSGEFGQRQGFDSRSRSALQSHGLRMARIQQRPGQSSPAGLAAAALSAAKKNHPKSTINP